MMRRLLLTILIICGLSLTVSAQDDYPEDLLETGEISLIDPELLLEIEFDDEGDWEFYEDDTGSVGVDEDDEVYLIAQEYNEERAYLWGQDDRIFGNVVIRVETEQLSREEDNGYGVMCRADPANSGDGYLFMISGDGYASIFINSEDTGIEAIYQWEQTDAINQGRDDNELVVVCVDNYLALYVNDELVAEVEDDTFAEGVLAFAASIFVEDEDVEVAFDNLQVWEVEANRQRGGRTSTTIRNPNVVDDTSVNVDELQTDIVQMLNNGDTKLRLNDVLLTETWDEVGEWFETESDGYTLEVDEVYRITEVDGLLAWGNNYTDYDDSVMHIELERISDGELSAFGMMCRLDTDNLRDGYAFLVTGDGYYAIGYWEDGSYTSLTEESFMEIDDYNSSSTHTLTVACVGDYLGLYLDGEFIGSVNDDTFSNGYAAVAAISFDDDGVEIEYDNLVIWEASE
ncbi:MAG: hypothetical protein ACFE0Q_12875 [Anaerolineae bacterium]